MIAALADTTIWPVSATGWVALVTSLATLVALPFSYGKWTQKMNGLGERVRDVEDACKLNTAFQQSVDSRQQLGDREARTMSERVKESEVRIDAIERQMTDHHLEQRALMEEIGRRQTSGLHELELRVEKLAANVETMTTEVRDLRKRPEPGARH